MSIVRYHRHGPRHAHAFQHEMRQAFDRFLSPDADGDDSAVVTAQWTPRVDVKEEAGRFVIYADLPGIDPADIEVQMDKGILSIKGERKSEAAGDSERYSRLERRYGSFHRRFALPDSADAEGVSAHGRNGVLEVVIPKKPDTTPRRVQVGTTAPQGEPTVQ